VRALAAGVPYDEIGQTTLLEIERRWRAKELEISMYARPHVELAMLNVSARSLGEAEEPNDESDPAKAKEDAEKHARWEKLGAPLKAQMREDVLFSLMSEHERAIRVYLHGWPEQKQEQAVTPLEGMSQDAAKAIIALKDAKTFTYDAWSTSPLWTMLKADDKEAEARLRRLADG